MKKTDQIHSSALVIIKAILFCILFLALFMAFSFTKSFIPVKFERIGHGTTGTLIALLTTYLFLRFDRRSFSGIGLKPDKATLKKFFTGTLTGIVIMGLMVTGVIYFSGFRIETNNNSGILNFFVMTLPLIPLAFMEEVASRAYPLIILKEKTGVRNAILLTSVLFALYHLANGWTITNSFAGAGVWGIIYGSAAIYSNGISMPTGLHYAANLTTSAFGFSNTSFNIWILKQSNGSTLENYQGSQLSLWIPQVSLLIVGLICMEWLIRKKKHK